MCRHTIGKLQKHKWENALTIDATSWGYNRKATYENYLTTEYFIHQLIETVAFGGNMLLNVGPTADGRIDPIFQDRLLGIGSWLGVNGKSIYNTIPWGVCQNETTSSSNTYYTQSGSTLYALVTKWPTHNILSLLCPQPTSDTNVQMLGLPSNQKLEWEPSHSSSSNTTAAATTRRSRKTLVGTAKGIVIHLPPLTPNIIPCQHAWVLAITGLGNVPQG